MRGRVTDTVHYRVRFADAVSARIDRRDFSRALDAFRARVIAGYPAVDTGSSIGAHLGEFARRGIQAIGVEPSRRMRELLESREARALVGAFDDRHRPGLPPAGGF